MAKAVRVHKVGGPEALVYEGVELAAPGPGEIRIRQHAVGLNFIAVYYRTGLYKAPGLPFIAGNEASGEVIAVGPGKFEDGKRVEMELKVGDKVLYGKYSGSEVTVDGESYLILRESDVLAIVG